MTHRSIRGLSFVLLALVAVLASSPAAAAPHLEYSIQYERSYSDNIAWADVGDKSGFFHHFDDPAYDGAWVHELSIWVRAVELGDGQDLNSVGFAVADFGGLALSMTTVRHPLDGMVQGYFKGNWATYTWTDGEGHPHTDSVFDPTFGGIGDAGPDHNDLRAILFQGITAHAANYLQIAEAEPLNLGSIFASWDGHTVGQIIAAYGDPPGGCTWSTWRNNQEGTATQGDVVSMPLGTSLSGEFHFNPEPATLSLLALGAAAMLRRRRSR